MLHCKVCYFHCTLEHLILFIHSKAYLPSICKEHGDGVMMTVMMPVIVMVMVMTGKKEGL